MMRWGLGGRGVAVGRAQQSLADRGAMNSGPTESVIVSARMRSISWHVAGTGPRGAAIAAGGW
jgi:hypothetical protein